MAIYNEEVLSELLNEGSINLDKNLLNIKGITMVIVHSNEGDNIPHFHIKRSGKHDCCIMLNEDKYFNHGNNDSLLSTKEAKELNSWLKKQNKIYTTRTNFQTLCDIWNSASHIITADSERLFDYSNITSYK